MDIWFAFTFWLLWITICQLHFERKWSLRPKSYCYVMVNLKTTKSIEQLRSRYPDTLCWNYRYYLFIFVHKIFLETFILCRISSLSSTVFPDLLSQSVFLDPLMCLFTRQRWQHYLSEWSNTCFIHLWYLWRGLCSRDVGFYEVLLSGIPFNYLSYMSPWGKILPSSAQPSPLINPPQSHSKIGMLK